MEILYIFFVIDKLQRIQIMKLVWYGGIFFHVVMLDKNKTSIL